MRGKDVIQRLMSRRDHEKDSYVNMAVKLGYKSPGSITDLLKNEDIYLSTFYKVCKYFGYVIVVMNPDDDTGKSDMVITMKRQPLPLTDTQGNPHRGRPRYAKAKRKPKYDRYRGVKISSDTPVLRSRVVRKKVIPGEAENECKNDT